MVMLDLYKYSKKNFFYNFIIERLLKIDVHLLKKDFLYIDNIDLGFEENIFYEYYKNNPTTQWVGNKGERDHYQSNHDLQKNYNFKKPVKVLERYLNKKIKKKIIPIKMIGQFKIKSMWFTIQQQNEKHSRHNHPKSILSGISYFKIDEKRGGELIIDKKDDKIKYMPKKNDLVIFNSDTMHSVEPYHGNNDRIAVAWDAIYTL